MKLTYYSNKLESHQTSLYLYIQKEENHWSIFLINKALEDGTSVVYDDVEWERKNRRRLLQLCLVTSIFSVHFLKLSRNWYFMPFISYSLVNYMDRKYVPYAQIESFYKYVYERRKANHNFIQNQNEIRTNLLNNNFSDEKIEALGHQLKYHNLTVYEAAHNIYEKYLDHARKNVIIPTELTKN
jgi:hypothetical protein